MFSVAVLILKAASSIVDSSDIHVADNPLNFEPDPILSNDIDYCDQTFPLPSLVDNNPEPSGSHHSLSYDMSNRDGRDGAFFLTGLFSHNFTTGLTASPFVACLAVLQHNLHLHGITVFGLTVDESRQLLIRHVLVGDCMRGSENKDRTACRHFRQGFQTANDMAASAFSTLLSTTTVQHTTDDLLLAMKALHITSTFRPRNLPSLLLTVYKHVK